MMLDKSARVDADELAFGIQFSMQFPENRSLAFSTACPQNADISEMKALLRKMSDAADFLDAMYRLRALKKFVEQMENELRTSREQQSNQQMQFEAEWYSRDRHGPLALTTSQLGQLKNFETTQDRIKLNIKKVKEEIAELTATSKG